MASKSALFIVAKREKTSIFLEPNGDDQVQTVIDTIAGLMRKNPDDVLLFYQNNKLSVEKTMEECHINSQGEAIVEPIEVNFVYRKDEETEDGKEAWEEVNVVPYAESGLPHDQAMTAENPPAADGAGTENPA